MSRKAIEDIKSNVRILKNEAKQNVDYYLSADATVEERSRFIGISGTIGFWLLLLIALAVSPVFAKKPKYQTVQIVLSSPEVKKVQSAEVAHSAPSAAPAEKAQPQKEESAPAEKAQAQKEKSAPVEKAKSQPKAASAKQPASTPKQTEAPVEYAMDMSDFSFNNSKAQSKKEFDWSQFDDSPSQESFSSAANYVAGSNSFEGSAGTTASSNTKQTSSSSTSAKTNQSASGSTTSGLGKVAGATANNNSVSTKGTNTATNSISNGQLKWADGRARSMWYPDSPDIKISKENSPGASVEVEISFTVIPQGSVTNIQFARAALLSEALKTEIRSQISKWQFDSADFSSEAKFVLNIIVR